MNDKRLIDANALEYQYAHMIYPNGTEGLGYTAYVTSFQIRCEPTIDPESLRPVGEWKLHSNGSGTCSQCHFTQKNVWDYDNWQNFCGVCGARMKGVV